LRAFLRGLVQPKPAGTHRLIPTSREERTTYPPKQHIELRFSDGSAKVVDPRSPEASALQELADRLRQSGS
jgi:hypothetical protein